MENGEFAPKFSIFHNIFKYMIFQRRGKALLWSKVVLEEIGAKSLVLGPSLHLCMHAASTWTSLINTQALVQACQSIGCQRMDTYQNLMLADMS